MLKAIKSDIKNALISLKGNVPDRCPDFFILGATRSGTTYLHHLLNNHHEIFMPKYKELHYFNHDGRYTENLKGYLPLFNGYKGQKAIGEATPLYFEKGTYYDQAGQIKFFREETTVQRIHKHAPDSKLIITLRDPVHRIKSLHNKNFYQKKVQTSLSEEVKRELDGHSRLNLIYRNNYKEHLEDLFKHYPRESVHLMIFEEWTQDSTVYMNDVSRFLNITPLDNWPKMPEKQNGATDYKTQKAQNIQDESLAMDTQTERLILEKLSTSNKYVEDLIGRKLPWKKLSDT